MKSVSPRRSLDRNLQPRHIETMLPALFLSHGAPTLPLDDCPARDFLRTLGESLPRPKAILVASAHWETSAPVLNAVALNETIHDFYGFPKALYEMRYRAPGSRVLAQRARGARSGGLQEQRG
jgi:4,5-DOPA dioxygenase extradiol